MPEQVPVGVYTARLEQMAMKELLKKWDKKPIEHDDDLPVLFPKEDPTSHITPEELQADFSQIGPISGKGRNGEFKVVMGEAEWESRFESELGSKLRVESECEPEMLQALKPRKAHKPKQTK